MDDSDEMNSFWENMNEKQLGKFMKKILNENENNTNNNCNDSMEVRGGTIIEENNINNSQIYQVNLSLTNGIICDENVNKCNSLWSVPENKNINKTNNIHPIPPTLGNTLGNSTPSTAYSSLMSRSNSLCPSSSMSSDTQFVFGENSNINNAMYSPLNRITAHNEMINNSLNGWDCK